MQASFCVLILIGKRSGGSDEVPGGGQAGRKQQRQVRAGHDWSWSKVTAVIALTGNDVPYGADESAG